MRSASNFFRNLPSFDFTTGSCGGDDDCGGGGRRDCFDGIGFARLVGDIVSGDSLLSICSCFLVPSASVIDAGTANEEWC